MTGDTYGLQNKKKQWLGCFGKSLRSFILEAHHSHEMAEQAYNDIVYVKAAETAVIWKYLNVTYFVKTFTIYFQYS